MNSKPWTHVLTPIVFEEGKNPQFSVMVQNQTARKRKISVTVNMQFWNPKRGVVRMMEMWGEVKVPSYGSSVASFEWGNAITEQEMHGLKNRNNLFFYIRGIIQGGVWPFHSTEAFGYIYNAWSEPRPRGIPLFVPCGGFTDPQKEKIVE